jgi:tetratricopeptide (TPR) repeat protein
MDAYAREQQPMDSVIRAAEAVLRIDSTSTLALMNLVSSYRDKHDTANAIDAMRRLVVYRPDLRPDLLQLLGQFNRPKLALPIIAEMLQDAPQDPTLLKQRWLFLLADHNWKEALRAGEEFVRTDSAAANVDYFTRSIATALSDSQPALAADVASRAVAKFPSDATLWVFRAVAQRKNDQRADALISVRRALELDPAVENGWHLLITIRVELGQVDSAIASGRAALAAKADSGAIRALLRVPVGAAVKRADSVKTRAAWLEVVRLSSEVDSILPSADMKYFLAVGAFQVGLDILQNMHTSCDDVKLAERMWATAAIDAPLGAQAGAAQKEGAAQIMTAIQKYLDALKQIKAAACRQRRD